MKVRMKNKWIKALRSGEYTQTIGTLRRDNSFCCLGVLCDVIDPSLWEVRPLTGNITYEGLQGSLSSNTRKKYNISYEQETKLMKMNDKENKSFKEIADYIEKEM